MVIESKGCKKAYDGAIKNGAIPAWNQSKLKMKMDMLKKLH